MDPELLYPVGSGRCVRCRHGVPGPLPRPPPACFGDGCEPRPPSACCGDGCGRTALCQGQRGHDRTRAAPCLRVSKPSPRADKSVTVWVAVPVKLPGKRAGPEDSRETRSLVEHVCRNPKITPTPEVRSRGRPVKKAMFPFLYMACDLCHKLFIV